jgi:hypothetical protein
MAGRDDRAPNALGGLIGGAIVDNSFGASATPPSYPRSRSSSFLPQERGEA